METIVFGGGCFWCTEAVFGVLKGVVSVKSGYAGGTTPNPTYESVSSGGTGHAEVLKIEYDPAVISFHDLLTVFFASHDPTTRNRQGADTGTQYRSIILYTTEAQKIEAEKYITELKKDLNIVTELKPLDRFYPAEDYHQDYYKNHEDQMYSQVVIKPKLEKLQKEFDRLLKHSLS
jgi:peptide-methionine (S)-S-oxide reductase